MANTKLLPDPLLNRLKDNRTLYQTARKVRMSVGAMMGARSVPGVHGKVHFNDFMLDSTSPADVEHYTRSSQETVKLLERGLAAAGKSWRDIGSMLEFGSGYGRITRDLVQKLDPAKITVCDIIAEGAEFCRREFGVKTIPATADFANFEATPSDLVFFLSVQTHLSWRSLEALQSRLKDLLTPNGICFFTTMGRYSADHIERYGERWVKIKDQVLAALDDTGFFFQPYGYYEDPDYGMTWQNYKSMSALMNRLHGGSLKLLLFEEAAEDNHQDIYVYQRV